jgi:hypothetical protein
VVAAEAVDADILSIKFWKKPVNLLKSILLMVSPMNFCHCSCAASEDSPPSKKEHIPSIRIYSQMALCV